MLLIAVEKVPDAMVVAMERAHGRRGCTTYSSWTATPPCCRICLPPAEVDRLYINFCDPWPKSNQKRRRLTHGNFLKLLPAGAAYGRADPLQNRQRQAVRFGPWRRSPSTAFHLSEVTRDLHADGPVGIMTDYEAKFYELGKNINRCVATMEPWTEPEEEPAEAAPVEASSVE